MPASLNCPTCGAPAPGADATRCEYCGSTLSTVACPSCFGTMFVGMEYCPNCGARAARVDDAGGAPLVCPGCSGAMRPVRVGAIEMHECSQCASLWLDAERFRALCVSREERGAVTAFVNVTSKAGDTGAVPSPNAAAVVRYVPCPVCGRIMNRQNFGHRSGVVIDVCKGHGVWFERNELRDTLAFIDSGGFERARLAHEQAEAQANAALVREFEQSGARLARPAFDRHAQMHASSEDGWLARALQSLLT